jgi:RNA polymerase sigma factor (sigma-70 family)
MSGRSGKLRFCRSAATYIIEGRLLDATEVATGLPDEHQTAAHLLKLYVEQQDEEAFAQIVQMHTGMVYAACLRVLDGRSDLAEDSAQATFVALARSAKSIRRGTAVAGWLYSTAVHSARQILRGKLRRRARERKVAQMAKGSVDGTATVAERNELLAHLDEALSALPRKQRDAVVLCCLDERSHTDVAEELNCGESTVRWRVKTGLARLQHALSRRDVVLGLSALAVAMRSQTAHAASEALILKIHAAVGIGGVTAAAAGASPHAATIAGKVLKMMFWTKVKTAAAVVAASATVIGGGVGIVLAQAGNAPQTPPMPKVWQAGPAPEGAPVKAFHGRVVDYGDDYAWRYPDQYGWSGGKTFIGKLDLDGDGEKDDCMDTIPFSLSSPINPVFPWDPEGTNARFYGGLTGFFMDTQKAGFAEGGGPNIDHSSSDDLNFMSFIYLKGIPVNKETPLGGYATNFLSRYYGVWLWKKADFRNGGDRWRVSFDKSSLISLNYARYWTGVTEGRFVVQDGDQFYISEFSYRGFPGRPEGGKGGSSTPSVSPLDTRWARYDPKPPHHIVFDKARAEYAKHEFTDVRVVGYYVCKEPADKRATWLKMGPFEVEAVVNRPARVSETLAMVEIAKAEAAPAFHISKTEIPYELWQKVYRWAASPPSCIDPGYQMDRDGDMGSMERGASEHGPDEPVTEMSWLDAVAWCNALSEYEAKTPCYYIDPELTIPFRKVRERYLTRELCAKYAPKVYPKWGADGYRLPTVGEWRAANADAPKTAEHGWIQSNSKDTTHPVGALKSNSAGVYDMLGNVWEYVWDAGEVHDPTADAKALRTVLGGGIHFPEDPTKQSASPYGDEPYRTGSYKIGFRVVRREAGLAKPQVADAPGATDIPAWTFGRGQKTVGVEPEPAKETVLQMVSLPEGTQGVGAKAKVIAGLAMSKCEISYTQWKRAYAWGVAKGYTFNADGDMGSMDWQTGQHNHSPGEPVTQIWFFDMLTWCNVLSEMEGLTPCYYTDEAKQTVYRHAYPGRGGMQRRTEGDEKPERSVWAKIQGRGKVFHIDPNADGYRLPTTAEWLYARQGGGRGSTNVAHVWRTENSGGKTHPVGTLKSNAFGLHDMAGNVFEHLQGASGRLPVRGGSFRYGKERASSWYFQPEGAAQATTKHAYPEIGFRVVRRSKEE